jgi:Flp pilus assembly protein TadG
MDRDLGNTGRRRVGSESGAAAVEFALLLPLFAMLVIGLISAGFTFHSWLSSTHGAQESARFAATLSIQAGGGSTDSWLATVGERAFDASNLGTSATARAGSVVCVAIYAPGNKFPTTITPARRVIFTADSNETVTAAYAAGTCPGMSPAAAGTDYVQVSVSRPSNFNFVLGSTQIQVEGKSTSHYEAVALS